MPKAKKVEKDELEEMRKEFEEDDTIVEAEKLLDTIIEQDDGLKDEVKFDGKVKKAKRGDGFGFLQQRKMNASPTSTYLVSILFGNGTIKHIVLEGKGNIFTYNKRKYHLNKSQSWYDVNHHQNRLIYYEDYAEPLNRQIYVDGDRRYLSITPDNMQEVMAMEYVKVLSQSQQLSKWLKIAVFLMIANLALTFINTLIFVLQSGILSGLVKGG